MSTMKDLPLTLYVVDDDEALRRSLLLLLFSQGLAVQAFESGEAFLDAVDMRQPGCVILDLRMGGMSGLAVFERLLAEHSPLVTLFLSAHGDIPTALEAVRRAPTTGSKNRTPSSCWTSCRLPSPRRARVRRRCACGPN